jgi:predicted kinase
VDCFRLEDKLIEDKGPVLSSAKNYFNLAYRYTFKKPILILFGGLMGTGKSTLAGALGQETGFPVISSDITRKRLAGVASNERHFEQFDSGIYSHESTEATYNELFSRAKEYLQQGQPVILDASFKKHTIRQALIDMARENNAEAYIIECVLDEAEVKRRLDKRVAEGSISDGRWEIFETQKRDFDKITEFPGKNHVIINTSAPESVLIKEIIEEVL